LLGNHLEAKSLTALPAKRDNMTNEEPKRWRTYNQQVCRICNNVIEKNEWAYAYGTRPPYDWEHEVCKESKIDGQSVQEEMLNRIMTIETQIDALYHRFFDAKDKEVQTPPKVV
jgi:uncharacterized protein YggL (DUF469 family)